MNRIIDFGVSFVFQQFALETGNGIDIFKEQHFAGIISSPSIKQSVLEFCDYCKDTQFIYQNVTLSIYAHFLSYFSLLFDAIKDGHLCLFNISSVLPEQNLIKQILSEFNQNISSKVLIKEIALKFHMSEKYFISYFKLHVGLSPKQYIVMCRMRRAMELLTKTNQKVSDIAVILGYSDQYSFSKAFRKYYHESPTSFRTQFCNKLK